MNDKDERKSHRPPTHQIPYDDTHHENLVINPVPKSSVFGAEYMGMLVNIVGTANLQTATQSQYNVERMAHMSLSAPPIVLPMPIPDPELLEPYDGSREGILFIGRHEPRKQPAVFARKVAQAGLPAKVLTNKNGESKFRKTFKKHGVGEDARRSLKHGTRLGWHFVRRRDFKPLMPWTFRRPRRDADRKISKRH